MTSAVPFGACTWLSGDNLAPPLIREFAIGMVWLVLIATFATYSAYYTALRMFPAAKVSAVVYLSRPVTMIWA